MDIEQVPSSPTLRQRLDHLPNFSPVFTILWEKSMRLLRKRNVTLSPCWRKEKTAWIPLDLDAPPFDNSDTKKEEVCRTYKGFDSFTQLFAYAVSRLHQMGRRDIWFTNINSVSFPIRIPLGFFVSLLVS